MSINYTAYTIIGSLVNEHDFWVKTERSVHDGCGEAGPGPYCPNCGRSIHAVEVGCKPIDGYEDPNAPNIEYHGRLYGLDVLNMQTAEGERCFVAGAIGECMDYDYDDSGVIDKMRCDVAFIAEAERKVRETLEKAGMWDPGKFGIWTVLQAG